MSSTEHAQNLGISIKRKPAAGEADEKDEDKIIVEGLEMFIKEEPEDQEIVVDDSGWIKEEEGTISSEESPDIIVRVDVTEEDDFDDCSVNNQESASEPVQAQLYLENPSVLKVDNEMTSKFAYTYNPQDSNQARQGVNINLDETPFQGLIGGQDCLRINETTGEKTYICSYCQESFRRSWYWKLHERKHRQDKDFKGSYCEKAYKTSSKCMIHARYHTEVKPYKCTYCDEAFVSTTHLKTHERKHTGVKPYKCIYCEKSFNTSGERTIHARVHTGEKPYQCSYCKKLYSRSGNLKMHERTHTGHKPFKCAYCEKSFNGTTQLKIHERVHTGERPYKCMYCVKTFKTLDKCKSHVRIHTGEKPYKCSYCEKLFKVSYTRNSHERTHEECKPDLGSSIKTKPTDEVTAEGCSQNKETNEDSMDVKGNGQQTM